MLAVLFLGTFLFSQFLDLVMWGLDRKHVLAKHASFILGGIEDKLVGRCRLILG